MDRKQRPDHVIWMAAVTVAGLLDALNYGDDPVNAAGESVPRIAWECSCLQAMCGGCAMVINGVPALACDTFVPCAPKEHAHRYSASRCLKCGLCLEVCPMKIQTLASIAGIARKE